MEWSLFPSVTPLGPVCLRWRMWRVGVLMALALTLGMAQGSRLSLNLSKHFTKGNTLRALWRNSRVLLDVLDMHQGEVLECYGMTISLLFLSWIRLCLLILVASEFLFSLCRSLDSVFCKMCDCFCLISYIQHMIVYSLYAIQFPWNKSMTANAVFSLYHSSLSI